MSQQDLHLLAAPYALDALDAHERARFEAHLDQCEECLQEVVGFHLTAARLADAEADVPPPALRDRLLVDIGTTSQERPVVAQLAQHGRLRRAVPRVLVAASVLAAAVSIGGFVREHDRAEELQAQSSQIGAIVSADDALTLDGTVSTGGTMRIVASPSHNAAVVMGANLQPLDDEHVYQVWARRDGDVRSLGVLGRSEGMLYVSSLGENDSFAVTVEPDGGSAEPTTEPVAAMDA